MTHWKNNESMYCEIGGWKVSIFEKITWHIASYESTKPTCSNTLTKNYGLKPSMCKNKKEAMKVGFVWESFVTRNFFEISIWYLWFFYFRESYNVSIVFDSMEDENWI